MDNTMKESWECLHNLPRFRPVYPSESVVRYMYNYFPRNFDERKKIKILDLGCGGGRHVKLFSEQGFDVYGIDFSKEGVKHTKSLLEKFQLSAKLDVGDTKNLPYQNDSFDGVIAYGVYYYGNSKDMKKSIRELHRVMRNGGKAMLHTRTSDDYRFNKGKKIEENTFILEIEETNEIGMINHFMTWANIFEYFQMFNIMSIEKEEITCNNMQQLNSNWIINIEK